VPVCLHCGETGPVGALFCTKCGYTLPQSTGAPDPLASSGSIAGGGAVPPGGYPTPPATSPYPMLVPTGPYLVAAPFAGAVGPLPPPPNAKFCTRCGTIIAQPAVYCPVCQHPQP